MLSNEELIKCPRCKHIFNTPVILPCGETICQKCVPHDLEFVCDFCQETHKHTDNKSFPINKKVKQHLDSFHSSLITDDYEPLSFQDHLGRIKSNLKKFEINAQASKFSLIEHCREIICEINQEADKKISQINSIRDGLLAQVNEYQNSMVKSLETKFNYLTSSIKDLLSKVEELSKDETIVNNIELYNSILSIELRDPKSLYEKSMTLNKSSVINFEPNLLGEIVIHSAKRINFNEIKPCIEEEAKNNTEDTSWLGNVKSIRVEKLENGKVVIAYIEPSWTNIFVHNLEDPLDIKKIRIHSGSLALKVFHNDIFLFFDSKTIKKMDSDLNEIKKVDIKESPRSYFVIDKYVVFTFKPESVWSEKNRFLNLYDTNLNYLTSSGNDVINNFLHIPEEVASLTQNGWAIKPRDLHSNGKYFFIRWPNEVSVVSQDGGKLVKSIQLSSDYSIIKVTDENVIIAEYKKVLWKIVFIDFDGKIRAEYVLDEFPDDVKLVVDDKLNLEAYDPIKMISYNLNSF